MERMEAEADELGADGIVAVRLTFNVHAWGTNVIEFLAIGTAVRTMHRRARTAPPTASRSPAISPGRTSGRCSTPGYRPLGFVMGNCVYYVGPPPPQQAAERRAARTRTQALYDARELAMERMQVEAEALKAEGIVGVTVDETNHTWGPSVLEFSAVGTAVVGHSRRPPDPAPDARACR